MSLGLREHSIFNSTEAGAAVFNGEISHDITALYTAFFGCTADSAGKIYWTQQVQEGHLIFVQGSGRRLSSHLYGNDRAQQSACHFGLHSLIQKGQPQGLMPIS